MQFIRKLPNSSDRNPSDPTEQVHLGYIRKTRTAFAIRICLRAGIKVFDVQETWPINIFEYPNARCTFRMSGIVMLMN